MDRGAIAAGALAAAAASIALAAATLPCRAAPPASSDDGHEEERLRQLRLGQLRTRAKAAGVDEKTVAGALDADDPKSALVALVLERSAATAGGTTTHGLRSELDAMRPGELHLRALADGATDQDVADALDHPDGPHQALVALILRLSSDPDGQMRSLLAKGASAALAAISRVLEQAVDALEQRAVSSPRTARRPVRTVVDTTCECTVARRV